MTKIVATTEINKMSTINEIIKSVKDLVGKEFLFFDSAIEIEKNALFYFRTYWAVAVSPDDQLYIMDSAENWWPVKEDDSQVIELLDQKIKDISNNYKQAI